MKLLPFAFLAAFVPLASGCSSKASLVSAGGQCQVATDCADGLACVPQKDGSSICSSDLSGVQQLPPKPPDAGTPDAGPPAAANDAATPTPDAAPSTTPDASPAADAAGD